MKDEDEDEEGYHHSHTCSLLIVGRTNPPGGSLPFQAP